MRTHARIVATLTAFALVVAVGRAAGAAEVNVYWDRGSYWAGPAFEEFTRQTGIAVRFAVKGEQGEAFERLRTEGPATAADLIITNQLARLHEAALAGLLQPVESRVLAANVPASMRDPELRWFGIAGRARTIVYSTQRVKPSELSTYEALGDRKWRNRLCLRTSNSHYTRFFLANLIVRHGERKAEQMVRGWMANNPIVLDGDSRILKAIAAGQCDVAITHTYYLGRAVASDPAFPVAPFWADQQGAGVHFPVAGAAVAAHAKNRAGAIRLLEFLTSEEAQSMVVDANFEYPVNPRTRPHPILAKWGSFKADDMAVRSASAWEAAAKLAERVGYR